MQVRFARARAMQWLFFEQYYVEPVIGSLRFWTLTGRLEQNAALVEGKPTFSTGNDRVSIGLTSHETGLTYHLHMSEAEAHRLAVFLAERSGVRA